MKLLRKEINDEGAGSVKIEAVEAEDMYSLYNLLSEGDHVRCVTVRKVTRDAGGSGKGGKGQESQRKKMYLTVRVEKIDFDTQACQLRLSGTNVEGNDYVSAGAHHTLEVEPHRAITLTKDQWDPVALEQLEDMCSPEKGAEAAAVVMQPGLAHVCVLAGAVTITKARIEKSMPKNNARRQDKLSKAMTKFFEGVYRAVEKLPIDQLSVILLGSPGNLKKDFMAYMMDQAVKQGNDVLVKGKGKFMLCDTTSGHKHALQEVLSQPHVVKRMGDTKAVAEVAALARFQKHLADDDDRACYGYGYCVRADELAAVETLLILDSLFRSRDLTVRKKYAQLVESVRDKGGDAKVLSSMHVSGEQLKSACGGLACLLRFPVSSDLAEGEVVLDSPEVQLQKANEAKVEAERKAREARRAKEAERASSSAGDQAAAAIGSLSIDGATKKKKKKKNKAPPKASAHDDYDEYCDEYEDYGYGGY